jgi:hypothetical protein
MNTWHKKLILIFVDTLNDLKLAKTRIARRTPTDAAFRAFPKASIRQVHQLASLFREHLK